MSDQANFDDDEDSVAGCTGACCDPVTMPVQAYRAVSARPSISQNGRYILKMLTPRGRLPKEGMAEFDCRYFDRETRRCIAYDRRPQMCRDFPELGLCGLCGARFEKQSPK